MTMKYCDIVQSSSFKVYAFTVQCVRPVAPSSPSVEAFSNRSVTLVWKHNTAVAHRPIVRFSVVVRSVDDDSRFVIPAPSNATTVIVDNLTPNTLYAFAVRAENAAGHSPFGPETRFRTLGEEYEVNNGVKGMLWASSYEMNVQMGK
ncbi:fibronectin type III domain protein [Dictyocaulus viviparus]|uniref:Fibronectin type III domain protein n=1 Tax=Dictyocaulus viviparus TaxID=29172 RepID=A0A0D8XXS4_DICVI|nr:fibronectin type III domain protein [Dictyocaulus viviparus]